ncbi:MAG: hypothetical protein ACREUT_03610 [Steroidobacteraceae bacterium]
MLRKDFRLFGLFALLNAALIVATQFGPVLQLQGLAVFLQLASVLSTALLILVIFHEDATLSAEHDWLTRPVPGWVLLLSKCAFVVLAILATAVLGGIAYSLYLGRSLGESLLVGIASGAGANALTFGLVVMVLAAVTANVRQATIAFLASIVTLTVIVIVSSRLSAPDEPLAFSGSQWVTGRTLDIIVGLLAVSVLWVQYRVRHTLAARVMIGLGVAAVFAFVALMTWSRIFSVQRLFSANPSAAASIGLQLAKGCFPARVFNADRGSRVVAFAPEAADEQRGRAGPDIVFSTRSIRTGIPADDRLTTARVQLTFRTADEVVRIPHPPQFPSAQPGESGPPSGRQDWLLPRSTYDRLTRSREVEAEIHYFFNLLAPQASAAFLADGTRAFYPGLGYCSATFSSASGMVDVDCFKWGTQPAQVVARLADTPGSAGSPSGYPDFVPAALDFWGGQRHLMRLRAAGSGIPRVNVTAFAAVAHFERRIAVPGVLGGPISSCPAP